MNKIIVRHSSIIINDYSMGDCRKLENMFSINVTYNNAYTTKVLKIVNYNKETKQLRIPRGMDISYLEYLFDTNAFLDERHDKCIKTSPILMKYLPRDNEQKEAIAFMYGEGGYRYTKQKSQLSLNLNTGKGKTYCTIATSSLFQLRTAIITSSIDWLKQWKECIMEYTDTTEEEIYMVRGSTSVAKLLTNAKTVDISKYKYYLMSMDTLKSYGDANGWDKISELFQICKIGMKAFDEAHLNFDCMAMIDYYTNSFKTYYITATPARSDKDENRIYGHYFKNIPNVNLFKEDKDPHTNYLALRYSSRPNAVQISRCMNVHGFSKIAYATYVVKQPSFYLLLDTIIEKALKNGGINILYIATIEAINKVHDWICKEYPDLINKVGIYHSKMSNKEKIDAESKPIILSTIKSLGTAKDIKGLKMVVVLAEPFKSTVLARQTLGRTRDTNTLYIDVVDMGFKSIMNYNREKRTTFQTYALSCSEVYMTEADLLERSRKIREARMHIPQQDILPKCVLNSIPPKKPEMRLAMETISEEELEAWLKECE